MVQDYEIDEKSDYYLALHPVASKKQSSMVEEHFEPVMGDGWSASDSDTSVPSDDEGGENKKPKAPRCIFFFVIYFLMFLG